MHTAVVLERLYDQFRVEKQIHRGLAVQKYDILEVQLIFEIWRLIDELGDVWLEFSVQLFELESPVCNLKVRIFFLVVVIRKVRV